MNGLPSSLVDRLYRKADAARWGVTPARFSEALAAGGTERDPSSLHLAYLALACACADGHEGAWEHFIREHRPVLYRAADAIDPSGGARDLADAIYADLFGVPKGGGERKSLLRYFHGRSSLSTWLRAVLAQRHVDRLRSTRRIDPLPEDESPAAIAAPGRPSDPDRPERVARMQRALGRALAALSPDDRLRLGCYYAREMTLAETGRLLGEHEATVSRQLAKTRRRIRSDVERILEGEGLSEAAIAECFAAVVEDAGPLDLQGLLPLQNPERPTYDPERPTHDPERPTDGADRKKPAPDRSKGEKGL